jgi:AraC-type DNA-binding domain-containing proteins
MELLYKYEHVNCLNYESGKDLTAEVVELLPGARWSTLPKMNLFLFLLDGSISFSFGTYENVSIDKGKIIFLPVDYNFACTTKTKSTMLIIRLKDKIRFCDCYRLDNLFEQTKNKEIPDAEVDGLNLLDIKDCLSPFLSQLLTIINAGVNCRYYLKMKVKELFYLFRLFYTKEELAMFFKDVLNTTTAFSSHVYMNHHKYTTMGEFAKSMNYTPAGFEKRFKQIFGVPAYKWMVQQRAKKLYHELCIGDSNLKQVAEDFGFSSTSSLNDFCKKHFSKTPGEIRNKALSSK